MTSKSLDFPRKGLIRITSTGAFIAEGATVTGEVTLEKDANIWFGCVLRGDEARLTIGSRTNIQDGTIIHTDTGLPNTIGSGTTVGHRCILHGKSVGDRCMIGMGAVLLAGSVVEDEALVAAGAVVRENFTVPRRTLVAGVPAKVIRELTDKEVADIAFHAGHYLDQVSLYLD
jgi:carbonic anhydrase/acetyltransferase-like protein (isoleucine patch superfamily)